MLSKITSCGIAIAPSSGIGYEIIASKTPFLSGFYVNNQLDILKGLENNGCIINLGDLRKIDLLTFNNALAQFESCNFVTNQINNQNKLIDGLSGERILAEFLELSES